jgi:hypothetical protein
MQISLQGCDINFAPFVEQGISTLIEDYGLDGKTLLIIIQFCLVATLSLAFPSNITYEDTDAGHFVGMTNKHVWYDWGRTIHGEGQISSNWHLWNWRLNVFICLKARP